MAGSEDKRNDSEIVCRLVRDQVARVERQLAAGAAAALDAVDGGTPAAPRAPVDPELTAFASKFLELAADIDARLPGLIGAEQAESLWRLAVAFDCPSRDAAFDRYVRAEIRARSGAFG